MNKNGILVVVSGFSGVGKGTLMKRLTEKYRQYALSVSATTRAPREGEEDGREYFFKSREEFERMIRENRLIEYASYCGNYYGTPREYVEEQMAKGRDVILEIEAQGAYKIKQQYPDTLLLFVMPPDAKTLVERLSGRGTESQEVIESRLTRALEESQMAEKYEYMVINEDLEEGVEKIRSLIEAQRDKIGRNLAFVQEIRTQLETLLKKGE